MSLTLVEGNKYSNNKLQTGVIELFVRDDPILKRLKFKTVLGTGLTYNTETTEPTVGFYDVGDTWVESTGTVTAATVTLTILGGDCDLDNFVVKTNSDLQDLWTTVIDAKTKALQHKWLQHFWYGYTTADPKAFNGSQYLISDATYNSLALGTSGTPVLLPMSSLEQTIDMVKGFKPQLLCMSKLMRRSINKYLHGVGGITYADAANARVQTLFDVPVAVSDEISNDESCSTQYGTPYGCTYTQGVSQTDQNGTTIFVLNFDEQGMKGIQAGTMQIETVAKDLETKDAQRRRIKWYSAIMLQSKLACAKLTGVAPAGVVTA